MTKVQPLQRRRPRLSLQETFLRLASITTPHGTESYCWPLLPMENAYIDTKGNVHIWVHKTLMDKKTGKPGPFYSDVMWSSHLDTADSYPVPVRFMKTEDGIIKTDGKSILGADCKIGAAIMVKMIEAGVPGWYVFHAGEECGLKGARFNAEKKATWPHIPSCCIAFDRKGYDEIITAQSGRITASDTFAEGLAAVLNRVDVLEYKPSPNGSFTDSYAYADIIPECTNIAVGYARQHTHSEQTDMPFAETLLQAILDAHAEDPLVFENLPVERDPNKVVRTYSRGSYTGPYGGTYTGTGYSGLATTNEKKKEKKGKGQSITDEERYLAYARGKGWPISSGVVPLTYDEIREELRKATCKELAESSETTTQLESVFMCGTCNTVHRVPEEWMENYDQFCELCGLMLEKMDVPVFNRPTTPPKEKTVRRHLREGIVARIGLGSDDEPSEDEQHVGTYPLEAD